MSNRTKKARTNALKKAAGSHASVNTKNSQHITKISAQSSNRPVESATTDAETTIIAHVSTDRSTAKSNPTDQHQKLSRAEQKRAQKHTKKQLKKSQKSKSESSLGEIFILARPFVAIGRYLRDSWREIRQVRWPNRKNTWKMTLAVLVYCVIFIVFIMLLDTFFTFLLKTFVK